MAFEANNLNVCKQVRFEKTQFNVECNVPVAVDVQKVLSICHNTQIESCEVLNGVINYSGTIELCVLLLSSDGEIISVNSSCPFTSKIENEKILVGSSTKICVDIEECQASNFSNGNVKVLCECVQSGFVLLNANVQTVSVGDDTICVLEDEMSVCEFVGQQKSSCNVESDVSIREPIKQIVNTASQVFVKSIECETGFVSVNGEVVTKILYQTENDRFETSYVTDSFKEEIEFENCTNDSCCLVDARVKHSMEKCETDSAGKGVSAKFSIPVELTVFCFKEQKSQIAKDVYSIANELSLHEEEFEMTKFLTSENFEEKIGGVLTLDDDKPRVDKLMFVGGANVNVTNSYISNGEVFVEGVTKTNAIYLNDEENSLQSVLIEMPFVVSEKTKVEAEDIKLQSQAMLFDVDVSVKKGREFSFDAKIKIRTDYFSCERKKVLCSVDVGEKCRESDCAIELLFAKSGQSAWDIGKEMKMKSDLIVMQNPDIVFPLQSDENIVLYRQKK